MTLNPIKVINTVNVNTSGAVSKLCYDHNSSKLFSLGFDDGLISLYRISSKDSDYKLKLESEVIGSPEPKCIFLLNEPNLIAVGHKTGVIYLYNLSSKQISPLCNIISLQKNSR